MLIFILLRQSLQRTRRYILSFCEHIFLVHNFLITCSSFIRHRHCILTLQERTYLLLIRFHTNMHSWHQFALFNCTSEKHLNHLWIGYWSHNGKDCRPWLIYKHICTSCEFLYMRSGTSIWRTINIENTSSIN